MNDFFDYYRYFLKFEISFGLFYFYNSEGSNDINSIAIFTIIIWKNLLFIGCNST